jgi:hydrogenase nickel incorporation protein HypA/HybF
MHELSLAQGLVEELEKIVLAEAAVRVERVVVVIGTYSGVERDAFEFAFPFAAEGTLCDGATLVVESQPIHVECRKCGKTSSPEPTLLACLDCGATDVSLTGGRDFLIRSVELEIP